MSIEINATILDLVCRLMGRSVECLDQYHPALTKALIYQTEHLDDPIRLTDLARHACTSVPHLCRLFRKEIGLSATQFLALLRVEASKRMLTVRRGSVTEAWEASGFQNFRSYQRAFKKWTGQTPREYRRAFLQGATSTQARDLRENRS